MPDSALLRRGRQVEPIFWAQIGPPSCNSNSVYTFQTQIEIFVLSLLDQNHEIALTQIAAARTVSLDYVNNLDSAFHSVDHDAKASRVAVAMLERTFDRLHRVLETPDGNDPPFEKVN